MGNKEKQPAHYKLQPGIYLFKRQMSQFRQEEEKKKTLKENEQHY